MKVLIAIPLFLSLSFFAFSQNFESTSTEWHQIKLAMDGAETPYVLNNQDDIIAPLLDLNLNINEMLAQIENSNVQDGPLVARVISMQGDDIGKLRELTNVCMSNEDMNELVLTYIANQVDLAPGN